jgi:hypothetical protein
MMKKGTMFTLIKGGTPYGWAMAKGQMLLHHGKMLVKETFET